MYTYSTPSQVNKRGCVTCPRAGGGAARPRVCKSAGHQVSSPEAPGKDSTNNSAPLLLESKQLFQSDWDIASFAVFFIFIGMVLLLVLLVFIRCCCCCCCDAAEKPRKTKVGIDNLAMEP
ncbi:small integral membrane protein 22 [Arapaima gigas]